MSLWARWTRARVERQLGVTREYLCREPWQSYYILRRGIMPCCYGAKPIAPMTEWATAWNSEAAQEIRRQLARGRLSAYCLDSAGCPVRQRYLDELRRKEAARPSWQRAINRALGGVPARIYRAIDR